MTSTTFQCLRREVGTTAGGVLLRTSGIPLSSLACRTNCQGSSILTRSSWLAKSPTMFLGRWNRASSHSGECLDTRPFIRACSTVPRTPLKPEARISLNRLLVGGGGTALLLALSGYAYVSTTKKQSDNLVKQKDADQNVSTIGDNNTVTFHAPSAEKKK
jgi:hypothetical protein